jgi:hypothetical protein
MGTVTNSLIRNNRNNDQHPDQAIGYCSHYFGLDQTVGYCFHHFGSGCWFLFPSFWIWMLVIVPIISDQAVGYCSHYFGFDPK